VEKVTGSDDAHGMSVAIIVYHGQAQLSFFSGLDVEVKPLYPKENKTRIRD
jgi:hypothetical protein